MHGGAGYHPCAVWRFVCLDMAGLVERCNARSHSHQLCLPSGQAMAGHSKCWTARHNCSKDGTQRHCAGIFVEQKSNLRRFWNSSITWCFIMSMWILLWGIDKFLQSHCIFSSFCQLSFIYLCKHVLNTSLMLHSLCVFRENLTIFLFFWNRYFKKQVTLLAT